MNFCIKTVSLLLIFSLFIPFSSAFASNFASNNEGKFDGVSAKSACLIEAESTRMLYSKNANQKMPMASTTKIMTAIIALESGISLETKINVPDIAVGVEGSSVYLRRGEVVSFEFLLYSLLLASANDSAVAIAYAVSDSVEKFVALMNKKAQDLGLSDTNFVNPHGLYDENHYTTASELAKIMAYAMNNTDFVKITSCKQRTFARDDGTSSSLSNHNRLLKTYEGVIGGKTGFTKKSGRCLVTCSEREGLRLIAVTLSAPDDWNDHAQLYDFGYSSYKRVFFKSENMKIPVISGQSSEILVSNEAFSLVLPKYCGDISLRINAPRFLFAELKQGQKIGDILYICNGKIIAVSPLKTCENVAAIKYKFNLLEWLMDFLKGFFD